MCNEDTASRVEIRRDMVSEDLLNQFLGRLLVSLGDLLECLVGGCKDGIVGSGACDMSKLAWLSLMFGRVHVKVPEEMEHLQTALKLQKLHGVWTHH